MSTVEWGRSVVEPERGHVREAESELVDGVRVGFAICGAFVVGDVTGPDGTFPTCTKCVVLLGEPTVSAALGAWLALRRVERGRVTHGHGLFLDEGSPLPRYLMVPLRALLDQGLARAELPRLYLTEAGQTAYQDLRRERRLRLAAERAVPFGATTTGDSE